MGRIFLATEIERKFLVTSDAWRAGATFVAIRQGYLHASARLAVRVRTLGERGFLTIKSDQTGARSRAEYEYEIPYADARELLDRLCGRPLIEKTRYALCSNGKAWVVDVFAGDNAGLVMAEVELADVNEDVDMPDWAGLEVTEDPRYLNANLAVRPYRTWSDEAADRHSSSTNVPGASPSTG
jgi:CYTH domain-containing protein